MKAMSLSSYSHCYCVSRYEAELKQIAPDTLFQSECIQNLPTPLYCTGIKNMKFAVNARPLPEVYFV